MASQPSIVLPYESQTLKNLAARQTGSLKFQFEDNDPIKLEVQDFENNAASAKAMYILDFGALYLCDYRRLERPPRALQPVACISSHFSETSSIHLPPKYTPTSFW